MTEPLSSNHRLDAQQQIIAIAEGLRIPDPAGWTWLEPRHLKLICQAIAQQAADVERLRSALEEIGGCDCQVAPAQYGKPCGQCITCIARNALRPAHETTGEHQK